MAVPTLRSMLPLLIEVSTRPSGQTTPIILPEPVTLDRLEFQRHPHRVKHPRYVGHNYPKGTHARPGATLNGPPTGAKVPGRTSVTLWRHPGVSPHKAHFEVKQDTWARRREPSNTEARRRNRAVSQHLYYFRRAARSGIWPHEPTAELSWLTGIVLVTREGATVRLWPVSEALNSLPKHDRFPGASSGPGIGGDTSRDANASAPE